MIKQKQMTEKELDQVSGGPAFVKLGDLSSPRGLDSGPINLQEACANGSFFKVEIHSPKQRSVPLANPRKRTSFAISNA